MQKRWKKFSKLDRVSIYIFMIMVIVLILGIILIETVSLTIKDGISNFSQNHDGFWILKHLRNWTIGDVIKGSTTKFGTTTSLSEFLEAMKADLSSLTGSAVQLQTGVILIIIVIPSLLFICIVIFGFSYYFKKRKK